MAEVLSKVLARHFRPELNTGTVDIPEWTPIKGLTNISPSVTKNDADTTDFDADGWLTHLVASRGASLQLQGQRVEDAADGTRDAGQEALEELGWAMGADSLKGFRMVRPDDSVMIEGQVSAEVTPFGGGNDDPAGWEATLTFAGEPVRDPAA